LSADPHGNYGSTTTQVELQLQMRLFEARDAVHPDGKAQDYMSSSSACCACIAALAE
jgi:hypothetical protein